MPLWTNYYCGGNGLKASRLAIGSDGAVYVSGTSNDDFVTLKYVWRTDIAIQLRSAIPPNVNLTLSGAPNSSWVIEWTSQLPGSWGNLAALVIGPNRSAHLQVPSRSDRMYFYRAVQQ